MRSDFEFLINSLESRDITYGLRYNPKNETIEVTYEEPEWTAVYVFDKYDNFVKSYKL